MFQHARMPAINAGMSASAACPLPTPVSLLLPHTRMEASEAAHENGQRHDNFLGHGI
jgi:hypothetical protein